jgi:hypothetical protein
VTDQPPYNTQPPWGYPPPLPPRQPVNWRRGLGITALAIVGLFLGAMTGTMLGVLLHSEAASVFLMLVGMWLGLCAGIVGGFQLTKNRPMSPRRQHGLEQMERFQRSPRQP